MTRRDSRGQGGAARFLIRRRGAAPATAAAAAVPAAAPGAACPSSRAQQRGSSSTHGGDLVVMHRTDAVLRVAVLLTWVPVWIACRASAGLDDTPRRQQQPVGFIPGRRGTGRRRSWLPPSWLALSARWRRLHCCSVSPGGVGARPVPATSWCARRGGRNLPAFFEEHRRPRSPRHRSPAATSSRFCSADGGAGQRDHAEVAVSAWWWWRRPRPMLAYSAASRLACFARQLAGSPRFCAAVALHRPSACR